MDSDRFMFMVNGKDNGAGDIMGKEEDDGMSASSEFIIMLLFALLVL